ncbi:isopentenyl-diphosphate Delta-isomerase [Donghicola eburneus]|uniref:Isopentenyl-diphosphate Delta-isomerase n=1 Tax=Donghicola eburneus TaxID=393278 RepID=A0A1M4N109_9RHOB|nr:isopentenyl-diphosphate Delta-isomerase [Donghicola eburneus]SCM68493.1 Isopentenyl-diphosphate Delta-isomerase [Donghicola eburneus]SFQ25657.1 isopentenyl-diphosphate delta-isomerase [Donghicola eburneus]
MADLIPAWRDGVLTPVEKLEVHKLGLRHPAISVFLRDGDRILIQQRALSKYHTPGYWANTCCTHPHWDEAPEACALRRMEEELGVTGITVHYREEVEYRADVGQGLTEHEVVQIYVSDAPEGLIVTPNPDEVMAVEWVTLPDLARRIAEQPDQFTPWLKVYMQDHADVIFA